MVVPFGDFAHSGNDPRYDINDSIDSIDIIDDFIAAPVASNQKRLLGVCHPERSEGSFVLQVETSH